MSRRMFVGGLSYDTTEARLRNLFESSGQVLSCRIITDRETGKSKGFGFVEMATTSDMVRALNELNGASLDGRSLRVDLANERPPRQGDRRSFQ